MDDGWLFIAYIATTASVLLPVFSRPAHLHNLTKIQIPPANISHAIMFNPATINLISKKNKIVSTDILANRIYHDIHKLYYRGEPANYHDTVSAAFRGGGQEYPFVQMKNEFKREVYHRLTADERKDFLAFA